MLCMLVIILEVCPKMEGCSGRGSMMFCSGQAVGRVECGCWLGGFKLGVNDYRSGGALHSPKAISTGLFCPFSCGGSPSIGVHIVSLEQDDQPLQAQSI